MSGKQRLVVVGNGMAGARAVEEILDLAAPSQQVTFKEMPDGIQICTTSAAV